MKRRKTNLSLRDCIDRLRTLCLLVAQNAEVSDAKVQELDAIVGQLAAAGLVPEDLYLGRVVLTRPHHTLDTAADSAAQWQAALMVPVGVGVVLWSTDEDYLDFHEKDLVARTRFKRYVDCPPALRVRLLPEAFPLVQRMLKDLM